MASEPTSAVPEELYAGHDHTYIHAAVLFADLENSVMFSSALPAVEYDKLINAFQQTMIEVVEQLKAITEPRLWVAEFQLAGDQLAVFFYDPAEVERNYLLDGPAPATGELRAKLVAECRRINEEIAFAALKAAIHLKNAWLVQEANMARALKHREPMGLALGLHYGRVYYRDRPDGRRRAEGYTINLAKRIESFARQGCYSRIMLSQKMRDLIRTTVVKHTQLRQRIFFHRHDVAMEVLKGVSRAQAVYELKFYHRIGVHAPPEAIEFYESLFDTDYTNAWAYYQLADHYAYEAKQWERVFDLAQMASVVHPEDEKIQYDLSKYYFQAGNFELSRAFAEEALRLNPSFDLAHEQLAMIASQRSELEAQIRHWRDSVRLSPSSAVSHLNLGLALIEHDENELGSAHVLEALRIYPDYRTSPGATSALRGLAERNKLPEQLQTLLPPAGTADSGAP